MYSILGQIGGSLSAVTETVLIFYFLLVCSFPNYIVIEVLCGI
jgi:hypothetical protein